MTIFGLHVADWLVLLVYFAAMIWVGRLTASKVHGQSDFFLAGRKLGRLFQFFLNFGSMTDASGAVRTSSIVYHQGVGGIWLFFQTLFMTPYYWFLNSWFRRTRLTTMADIFPDRFGGRSRFLALIYALSAVFFNIISIGGGFLVTYKVLEIFIVKPPAEYTAAESEMIREFEEFSRLNAAYKAGKMEESRRERFEFLKALHERGEIRSYVSYIRPLPVCLISALVVGIYVILGGMKAAAITDAFQGIMVVVFSVILIPFGIMHVGGMQPFQEKIPDRFLDLFGSGGGSEFTWYSIAAIFLVSMVQIHGVSGNMAIAGSARDERSAALGVVSGGFVKRLMMIAWCFCGLLAFALFGGGISDPDTVWGALCRVLLGPGFFGLMLVGLISAEMSTMSAQCLTLSALFVRNLYMVLWPHKTEAEGLRMARFLVGFALIAGTGIALFIDDLLTLSKMQLTLNVAFGAAIWMIFKWRRVTEGAVTLSVVLTLLLIVGVPFLVPAIPALRSLPSLHLQTVEQKEVSTGKANDDDLAAGRAAQPGEPVEQVTMVAPKAVFFDRLVSLDPRNPSAGRRGEGRFNFELFLVSLTGLDLARLHPAQLLAITFVFDGIFPFVFLFGVSLLTREKNAAAAERFYIKMRTPVVGDPGRDALDLSTNLADPALSETRKLFPNSTWEFQRWSGSEALAFLACCLIALAILGVFVGLLQLLKC